MGLKVFLEGPIKGGKTIFAMTLSEGGDVGYVDTEQRVQWYTRPLPPEETLKRCPWLMDVRGLDGNVAVFNGALRPPYENPRVWRSGPAIEGNPTLKAVVEKAGVIFLVEAMDPLTVKGVIDRFAENPHLYGIAWDTMTDTWDLLQEMKDPNPKKDRLGWEAPRRLNRHLLWAGRTRAHVIITSHLKTQWEKQGAELVKTGETAAVQPHSPRWADIHLRLVPVEGSAPNVVVRGEATLGMIPLGAIMEDPTFGKVLRAIEGEEEAVPEVTGGGLLNPKEAEYRTVRAIQGVDGAPMPADPSNPEYEGAAPKPLGPGLLGQ